MNELRYWDIMRPVGLHAKNLVARRLTIRAAMVNARLRETEPIDHYRTVYRRG